MQRVEPSARLVLPFGNELCGEVASEIFLVFERIMKLCVRHRAGIKPHVEHFRDAAIRLPVFFDDDIVDDMFMQVINIGAGKCA